MIEQKPSHSAGSCAGGESLELFPCRAELGDPGVDFGESFGDRGANMLTRWCAAVADVQDPTDLLEREPGSLGMTDEVESFDAAAA